MEGGAGDEREGSAVVFYVEHKSLHLIRHHGGIVLFQKGRRVFGDQVQHEMKCRRRALSLDQIKADGAYLFPLCKFIGARFPVLPFLGRVERPVFPPVYRERVVGADGGMFQQKGVEGVPSQELVHKLFDVFYLQ